MIPIFNSFKNLIAPFTIDQIPFGLPTRVFQGNQLIAMNNLTLVGPIFKPVPVFIRYGRKANNAIFIKIKIERQLETLFRHLRCCLPTMFLLDNPGLA